MLYAVRTGGIGAAEEKTVIHISVYRSNKGIRNAVGNVSRIAMFQTFVAAGGTV